MKKTAFLLILSAYLLNGCHSHNTPAGSPANPIPTQPQTANSNANNSAIASTNNIPGQPVAPTPPPADNSIKNGPHETYYPNGVIMERSFYMAGRRNGECQSFYPTGKLCSDDFFAEGLINGASTTYYENGQKRYEGTFTKGLPSGVWKYYDNTGKLVRTKDYGKKQANPAM